MKMKFETRGEGIKYTKDIAEGLPKELKEKTRQWADIIRDQAKMKASKNKGQLQRSIKSKVFGFNVNTIFGVVGTRKWYAHLVERGAKTHFVPFAKAPNLVRWLKRQGTMVVENSNGRYDVMLKGTSTIMLGNVKGIRMSTKARPFLQPAFDSNVNKVMQDFNFLLDDVKNKV